MYFEEIKVLFYLGILTSFMARSRAIFEIDLKKIIAYSTLRQLGIIVMAIGIGWVRYAFLHLIVHALFKALIFICGGKFLSLISGLQDKRKIGGVIFNVPVTRVIMSLSILALCGVPFLSGFYSKDLIMERSLYKDRSLLECFILMACAGFSIRYSFRLVGRSISRVTKQGLVYSGGEADWVILGSKFFLMVLAVIRGGVLVFMFTLSPLVVALPLELKLLTPFSVVVGLVVGVTLRFRRKALYIYFYLTHS